MDSQDGQKKSWNVTFPAVCFTQFVTWLCLCFPSSLTAFSGSAWLNCSQQLCRCRVCQTATRLSALMNQSAPRLSVLSSRVLRCCCPGNSPVPAAVFLCRKASMGCHLGAAAALPTVTTRRLVPPTVGGSRRHPRLDASAAETCGERRRWRDMAMDATLRCAAIPLRTLVVVPLVELRSVLVVGSLTLSGCFSPLLCCPPAGDTAPTRHRHHQMWPHARRG